MGRVKAAGFLRVGAEIRKAGVGLPEVFREDNALCEGRKLRIKKPGRLLV
jgi:hypothetical protein